MAAPRRLAKQSKVKAQKHELEAFAEQYDTLSLIYGDPITTVFAIMARNARIVVTPEGEVAVNDELALRAATELMQFRFPKVKAAEGSVGQAAPVLNFNVTVAPPTREITPAAKTTIAITDGKKST